MFFDVRSVYRVRDATVGELSEHMECIYDEVLEDEGAIDPDFAVDPSGALVEFTVTLDAEHEAGAIIRATGLERAAIAAAEACEAGWIDRFEVLEQHATPRGPRLA